MVCVRRVAKATQRIQLTSNLYLKTSMNLYIYRTGRKLTYPILFLYIFTISTNQTQIFLLFKRILRIKKERRQKELQKKQKLSENRRHLADVRVVQKNLVFIVGLSQRLADIEVLKKQEYFGKFGKILKVVVNPSPSYAGTQV